MVIAAQELVGEVLVAALERRANFQARLEMLEADTSASALVQTVVRWHPEVVVVSHDVGSPETSVALVTGLAHAGSGVVAVTTSLEPHIWGRYLAAGARAVLPHTAQLPELMGAIRATTSGQPTMSRVRREALMALWSGRVREHAEAAQRLRRLTPGERLVLARLMEGFTVTKIAKQRVVSTATVRTQVKSILSKLEVNSQVGAVGLARRLRAAA
jgi:DNA-binding NarL/FixJ family response regulator